MACCGGTVDGERAQRPGLWRGCVLCRVLAVLCREKTPAGDPCVVVPGHLIRKPDPCIYDQFLLMQLNQPVTWDNPDVRIFLNGVEQYTYNLTADTEYDVEVTVHNSSRDKPADRHHGRRPLDRVRRRRPDPPSDRRVRARTCRSGPALRSSRPSGAPRTTPGHYCIEVELSHPDDGNPANNRGWNNTQVYAAIPPVTPTIPRLQSLPGRMSAGDRGRRAGAAAASRVPRLGTCSARSPPSLLAPFRPPMPAAAAGAAGDVYAPATPCCRSSVWSPNRSMPGSSGATQRTARRESVAPTAPSCHLVAGHRRFLRVRRRGRQGLRPGHGVSPASRRLGARWSCPTASSSCPAKPIATSTCGSTRPMVPVPPAASTSMSARAACRAAASPSPLRGGDDMAGCEHQPRRRRRH